MIVFVLTSALMCTDAELVLDTNTPDDVNSDPRRVEETSEVRYHLAWDWGEAESSETGWRVTTDRGYDVEVTEGFLITYSVQLAPCADEELGRNLGLNRLFGAQRAFAGHGGLEDPSAWLDQVAEPLHTPEPLSLEPVQLDTGHYCRAHYLVARADTKARDLPGHVNMVGSSLYIVGTSRLAGAEAKPFVLWSTLPVGELMTWSDPVRPINLAEGGVDVTITRDLGRLFDGVNFDTMSQEAIEKTVLLSLASGLQVSVD